MLDCKFSANFLSPIIFIDEDIFNKVGRIPNPRKVGNLLLRQEKIFSLLFFCKNYIALFVKLNVIFFNKNRI